ncbi:hypothetical protein GBAR_LOCUS10313 [Geodia barretti]|uniref:Uncharacterized protein n=1 Tax=Geodia barretti TaxID=519541 RepID=A0AA35RSD9_GEOBA|nr:hypothetical protein GBAR_LOCUS10313 [Geodia barretti]
MVPLSTNRCPSYRRLNDRFTDTLFTLVFLLVTTHPRYNMYLVSSCIHPVKFFLSITHWPCFPPSCLYSHTVDRFVLPSLFYLLVHTDT